MAFHASENKTGWSWGPCRIIRMVSDDKHGVWVLVAGQKEEIEIGVTMGGHLRVSSVRKRTLIGDEDEMPKAKPDAR